MSVAMTLRCPFRDLVTERDREPAQASSPAGSRATPGRVILRA
jgi:hypothetical protein